MEAGLQGRLSLHHDTKPTSWRWKDQYPSLGTFESRDDTWYYVRLLLERDWSVFLSSSLVISQPILWFVLETLVHLTSYSVVIIVEFSTGVRKAWWADCIIHVFYTNWFSVCFCSYQEMGTGILDYNHGLLVHLLLSSCFLHFVVLSLSA